MLQVSLFFYHQTVFNREIGILKKNVKKKINKDRKKNDSPKLRKSTERGLSMSASRECKQDGMYEKIVKQAKKN